MPRKIALLTSFMHQRGGDLVAAMSFMKAVWAVEPDAEFEWVVKRDISSFNKDLAAFTATELGHFNGQVRLTVLDSSDYQNVNVHGSRVVDKWTGRELSPAELTTRSDANWGVVPNWYGWQDVRSQLTTKPVSDRLASCDMMAVVGNNHRMVQGDYQMLTSHFKKPIKLVPEYDLYHNNNTTYSLPKVELIQTGFGGSGVYIDDTVTSANDLNDAAPADNNFVEHLVGLGSTLDEYKDNHRLFYGYFFDVEKLSPSQFVVKTKSYITNSIMLAMDSGGPSKIDIVIPGFKDGQQLQDIYEEAIKDLPPKYKQLLNNATYDIKQDGDFVSLPVFGGKPTASYEVRLVNPQRLERQTIQALLNDSEPWVGLTGDASWIEGLMKGKIVCYQVVQWKQQFFQEFLRYASSKLSRNSPLLAFYRMQDSGRFEQMRNHYQTHLPQMQQEALQLANFIVKEKNLNHSLSKMLGLRANRSSANVAFAPKVASSVTGKGPGFYTATKPNKPVPPPLKRPVVPERSDKLGNLIALVEEHLDAQPLTEQRFNYFTSVHDPAKEALRDVLLQADEQKLIDGLQQYYKKISHPGMFAGWFSARHKKEFEVFMQGIGVAEKGDVGKVLAAKIAALDLDELELDGLKDHSPSSHASNH